MSLYKHCRKDNCHSWLFDGNWWYTSLSECYHSEAVCFWWEPNVVKYI